MENLKNQGWILTESSLKSINSSGNTKNLMKTLLDRDLREIGAGIGDLSKGKIENLDHDLAVLQIMKIRNISAPKANESSKTAPKLLKLQLTDGINTYSAIEMEPTNLTIETKPGTKISLKIKQLKTANGQFLFTPKNIEVLGGHVEALVSKWEVTKSLAGIKGSRIGATGGPPPFIPFGQKIQGNLPNDQRGFKSLQSSKTKENEIDDSEFKAQRQDAIAEASKAGTKKTFGGGTKVLIDTNVQKIIDKGYSDEQATTALKWSRNSVEKALHILKKRDEHKVRENSHDYEPRESYKDKRESRKGANIEPQSAKPSGAVSLFDYLENKIPTPSENAKQSAYDIDRFENNISSSFRKTDKDFPPGGKFTQNWSSNEHKSSHNYKASAGNFNPRDRDNGRDQNRDFKNNRDTRGPRDFRGGDGPRDTRDAPRDSRDSRDGPRGYRDRDEDNNKRDSKYNSNYPKSDFGAVNQYQKPSSAPSNNNNNDGGSNNYTNNFNNKGKYQKTDYNTKPGTQKEYNNFVPPSSGGSNNKYDSNKYESNKYESNKFENKYDSNKPRGTNSSSKFYGDQQSNDGYKGSKNIVDSMDKMNLKGNQKQYKAADIKLNASNYPPLTQATAEPPKAKVYPKQPSGYPIMGFQNKEANEHAQNALKTKNIPAAQQPSQAQQQQQQQHHKPNPSSNWQQQNQVPQHSMPVVTQQIKTQPPPPFPNSLPPTAAPPTMHTMPQPFVQHQAQSVIHAAVISGSNAPPGIYHQPYSTPIMMQTVAPPPGMVAQTVNGQQLKSGDMCLAKYWEDGQFYNARITNVSESTYVVVFTEYGNAEEIRKNDCLPLMPACPTPPNTYVSAGPINTSYRIPNQKVPHHGYPSQAPPVGGPMPYKNNPIKTQRRN